VGIAQGDPDIFLLLPLLEEGIGSDRISDMAQNIIDEGISVNLETHTKWLKFVDEFRTFLVGRDGILVA